MDFWDFLEPLPSSAKAELKAKPASNFQFIIQEIRIEDVQRLDKAAIRLISRIIKS